MAKTKSAPTAADIENRRAHVERLMSQRLRTSLVVKQAMKDHKVSKRTIDSDIAHIKARWAQESKGQDRDSRRDSLRVSLNEAIAMAFSRKVVVKDEEGRPVIITRNGKKSPLTMADPDVRAIIRGIDVLSKIDGISSITIEHELQGHVEQLMDAVRPFMEAEAYEQLIRALGKAMGVIDVVPGQIADRSGGGLH